MKCAIPAHVAHDPSEPNAHFDRYNAVCDHVWAAAAPSSSVLRPMGSRPAGTGDPYRPHRRLGLRHTAADRRQPPPARRTRSRRRDVARTPHDSPGGVLPAGHDQSELPLHRPGDAVHVGRDRRGHLGGRIRKSCPTPARGNTLPRPPRGRRSPESAAAPPAAPHRERRDRVAVSGGPRTGPDRRRLLRGGRRHRTGSGCSSATYAARACPRWGRPQR